MPNRSIRDEMQDPTAIPRAPRVYGTPIGATGGRPINTGRTRVGPASPEVRQRALQAAIGNAAVPRPSSATGALASAPLRGGPAPMPPQGMVQRPGMPPPQASAGAPGPTTLVPGNPTADLSAQTAGNRIMERPGLINQAVDQIAR